MRDCEKLLSLLLYPAYLNASILKGDRTNLNPIKHFYINLINNLL